MFGIDADQVDVERARLIRRRKRWKRALLTLVELAILLPTIAVTAAAWLIFTPSGNERLIERFGTREHSAVRFSAIVIHPASVWHTPDTWRFIANDVVFTPADASRTEVKIHSLVLTNPDIPSLWYRRQVQVREAWLIGLQIRAKQQRAAPKRPRNPKAIQRLQAGLVHVWDASYTAPADDPLPPASVTGIYGDLSPVEYDPFSREVTGVAALTAQTFQTGTLAMSRVKIGRIDAVAGDVTLQDGSVHWQGQTASVSGTVLNMDGRATVELTVRLRHARVEDLVTGSTGEPSPLMGRADVDLRVYSGGELPRGAGYMDAHVKIENAILPLPDNTRGLYKDIIRLAPMATLDEQDRVHLKTMVGDLTLRRGVVTLHQLLYDSKIPIVVRGTVNDTDLDMYVRFVLGGDPLIHPGRGLRLKGPLTQPEAAWASRDELLPGWREMRTTRRQDRRIDQEQRRAAGLRPRWMTRKKKAEEQDAMDAE
ncbi:MAG: hypothetical protein AB8H79_03800 [Myxococcota bacterium]